MDVSQLCINCFKIKGASQVCEHCGAVQQFKPKQQYHLFPHTVLKDRYVIGQVINNGGFGIIYKAYDIKLKNIVAIKEFFPTQNSMVNRASGSDQVQLIDENSRDEFLKMKNDFINEARTVAKFNNCESIVRIYEYFEENETAYVVMEFLEGISLREYFSIHPGAMDFNSAMSVITPVAEALKVLHNENIIHCNICPDNIFICLKRHIKLIDFSEAKLIGQSRDEGSAMVAKPGYTAPEQYSVNGKVGPYTDIYALGAVLYNMLSGTVPSESIVRAHKDNLQKLSDCSSEIPPYADKSVMKAMALSEENRFKTVDDFIGAVQGRKHAEFPEVELKKKKMVTKVGIFAVFAIMILSVVGAFLIKSASSIVPTSSATIDVWYVENDSNGIGKRWNKIKNDFNEYALRESSVFKADIKIKTTAYSSEKKYKKALEKAFKEGKGPDFYQSDMLSDDKNKNAQDLEDFYSQINDEDFGKAYEAMKKTYAKKNRVAFCYDMPVLYVSKLGSDYVPGTGKSLSELMQYDDPDISFDYSLVTNPDAVLYASCCYGYDREKNKDKVEKLYDSARNFGYYGDWKNCFDLFMRTEEYYGQKITVSDSKYYIGFISEFCKLNELAAQEFDVLNLTGKKTQNFYIFPEVWSVNKNSSKEDKKAAIFLLYFLLNNVDGQDDITQVNYKYHYLPLNNSASEKVAAQKEYKDIINYDKKYLELTAARRRDISKKSKKISSAVKDYYGGKYALDEILK